MSSDSGSGTTRARVAKVRTLILFFAFTCAVPVPGIAVRWASRGAAVATSVKPLSIEMGGSTLIPVKSDYRRKRRRRNPAVRIFKAPYKATKVVGRSIGRGMRRLFTGATRRRRSARRHAS